MAQRQFRSDDTSTWVDRYGAGGAGSFSSSGTATLSFAISGCSGTAASTSLTVESTDTFANGDLVIIQQTRGTGAGAWELNKISSGTGSTTFTLAYSLINTYANADGTGVGANQAQITQIKQYTTFTVNSGHTISPNANWSTNTGGILPILAKTSISIAGTLTNAGGYLGGNTSAVTGEGTVGGFVTSASANGNGGGGGQNVSGNSGGGGASGGHSSTGSTASNSGAGGVGGTGGTTAGTADLRTMVFGGAGGAGGGWNFQDRGGRGGAGGGIILLIAPTITITGAITAPGATGGTATGSDGSGGGAGAGGSVLLKGQTITLGTTLVTALGAVSGGPGDGGGVAGAGSASNGRIHVDWSKSLSGTTTPTLDSRQDTALADLTGGGAFLFNLI